MREDDAVVLLHDGVHDPLLLLAGLSRSPGLHGLHLVVLHDRATDTPHVVAVQNAAEPTAPMQANIAPLQGLDTRDLLAAAAARRPQVLLRCEPLPGPGRGKGVRGGLAALGEQDLVLLHVVHRVERDLSIPHRGPDEEVLHRVPHDPQNAHSPGGCMSWSGSSASCDFRN